MSKGKEFKLSAAALDKLAVFEKELRPDAPEAGSLSPKILGYGEMSTVFAFSDSDLQGIAFKRMAIFETDSELSPYEVNFIKYHELLNEIGIETPDYGTARGARNAKPVMYACQRMVDPARIGNKCIQTAAAAESISMFSKIINKINILFRYNEKNRATLEIGLDGQISNWVVYDDGSLGYLDTSTPLMRLQGVEQLNSELFLRICPSYLVWVIRLFFLKDVLTRYYDLRLVIIDLIANLHKEKKPDLIVPFLQSANQFLEKNWPDIKAITEKEITAYYKEDAMIWRIFLAFRKLERWVKTRIQRKEYPLILPGKIER